MGRTGLKLQVKFDNKIDMFELKKRILKKKLNLGIFSIYFYYWKDEYTILKYIWYGVS